MLRSSKEGIWSVNKLRPLFLDYAEDLPCLDHCSLLTYPMHSMYWCYRSSSRFSQGYQVIEHSLR